LISSADIVGAGQSLQALAIPDSVNGYMLDTNEFNAVAKGYLPRSAIAGRRLFATHVQRDEINNTPCERMRAQLHVTFEEIAAEKLPTESFVWGASRWGQAKWSGGSFFEAMRMRLEALDNAADKKLRHPNQLCDILIAETAIRNELILVSRDENLRTVIVEFGGHAIDLEQFTRIG
jgi:hypothetical protein